MKAKTIVLTAVALACMSTAAMAQNGVSSGASQGSTTQDQAQVPDYGRSGNNTLPPAGAPDTMKPGSDDTSQQPNNYSNSSSPGYSSSSSMTNSSSFSNSSNDSTSSMNSNAQSSTNNPSTPRRRHHAGERG